MPGKGNNYQQIILIAVQLLEKTGEFPTSLGALSGEISGLSAKEVAGDFQSIEALHTAVLDHATVLLADAMGHAMATADADDPHAQLLALGTAFFDWGFANRTLFSLLAKALFTPGDSESEVLARHRHAIRDLVERKLHESQKRGLISDELPVPILLTNTQSIILGISSMLVQDCPDPWYKGDKIDLRTLCHKMVELQIDLMFHNRD